MKDTIKYAIGQLEENTFFAPGAIENLKEIIKNYNSILLFYDKEAFKPCGAEAFFQTLSERFPIRKIPYSGKALPIEDIQKIYDDIKNIKNIDLIIAVGGGTIIDLTKICALTISNELAGVDEVLTGKTFDNKIDLAFIPTTAGTGSEATTFAVVYKDKKKFSILSPTMLPRYTILDPHLLRSLPEKVLNATLLDALAQGIESMWAAGGTDESREYARIAISSVLTGLEETDATKKLEAFLLGAHFSGRAINISKTTISHAISYPLTSYFGIPHGIAVFLTLPQIARLNFFAEAADIQANVTTAQIKERFAAIFELFAAADITALTKKLKDILAALHIKEKLRDYGLKKEDLPITAENSFTKGRSDNNPRKISKEIILNLLGEIY
ncbi:MAG: phosphonoacetaldehyde reductase [Candidatus Aminicenantes bacterium]|nr:phosphonoacetaldehyde reductase [Candidatus Aminicenantes bacterium]